MIIPKPEISPDLTLTPEERLRLEFSTRQPPRPAKKPVFKERLLIYHGGVSYTNYIAILRVFSMFAASMGILIIGPAYLTADGVPWWTGPLILVGTIGSFFVVNFVTRPFVSWIYLSLPNSARHSPQAALEYSKNLPRNAMLQICSMRPSALMGQVDVSIADLVPSKGMWPPRTFKWVGSNIDLGPWYNRKPTQFFVNLRSGTGKASRDTIPGIWENVYPKIMKLEKPKFGMSSSKPLKT